MADNIEAVQKYAINLQVARSIQQMLKVAHEDIAPEQQKMQDLVDKHMSARIAQTITKFGV